MSPILEEKSEENQETTENTPLLATPPCQDAANSLPSNLPLYDSTVLSDGAPYGLQLQTLRELKPPQDGGRDQSVSFLVKQTKKDRAALLTLCLAAAVAFLTACFSHEAYSLINKRLQTVATIEAAPFSMLLSTPLLGASAPDPTFSELAQSILPAWYADMLASLNVLTNTVLPGKVYMTRKVILKTRDLLDVFGPIYPNSTGEGEDLWLSLSHYLDAGYMTVGEFLDLNHAHVRYTHEQMVDSRDKVLDWKSDFAAFRQTHDIPVFLTAPSTFDSFHHQKESRFFWKTLEDRPSGRDPATARLPLLGSHQLDLAMQYLKHAYPYKSVLNESVHEYYHNLRKTLRSLTDEFSLFGSIMFANTSKTFAAIDVLNTARTLLGDMNDDWTAYRFYVEHDEYYTEQARLAKKVDEEWAGFKLWLVESNFEVTIQHLAEGFNSTLSPSGAGNQAESTMSLDEFLNERKQRPTQHFVIGNEAGDADTIISAIALAYVESSRGDTQVTPVVSIPKTDLETQRPDIRLLLELSGISHPAERLIFVDDPIITDDANGAEVTLVDHNLLGEMFQRKNWTVVEIIDHHEDEGQYLDSCSGEARTIAFADDEALVASACTLVAERLKELWMPPYPASIGAILLGVILLDSVNLSPEAGKVTQRDRDAVRNLLDDTNWQELSKMSQKVLEVTPSSGPNTTTFFDVLQDTKYDPGFWKSLSVRDALRYDYKDYSYENGTFGVSSVLMPMKDFLSKSDLVAGILQYMAEVNVAFLGIMSAFEDDGHLRRQLALCGTVEFPMDDLVEFLLKSEYDQESLDLKEMEENSILHDNAGLTLRFFDQHNVKSSRKQIAPILLEFFAASTSSKMNAKL